MNSYPVYAAVFTAALTLLIPCSLDSQGEAPLDERLVSSNFVTVPDLDDEPTTGCWPVSCRQGNTGLVVKCSLAEPIMTEYMGHHLLLLLSQPLNCFT